MFAKTIWWRHKNIGIRLLWLLFIVEVTLYVWFQCKINYAMYPLDIFTITHPSIENKISNMLRKNNLIDGFYYRKGMKLLESN